MATSARARAMPKLLVVDDDYDIREMTAELLGLAGYSVSTATNGKTAIEQAVANQPDVILLDLDDAHHERVGVPGCAA